MVRRTRRWFVRAGVVSGTLGVAGCQGLGDGGDSDGGDGGGSDGDDADGGGGTTAAATTAAAATTTVATTATTTVAPTTAPPTTAPPTTAEPSLERSEPIAAAKPGGDGPRDVFEGLVTVGDRAIALGSFDGRERQQGWARAHSDQDGSMEWETGYEVETRTNLYDAAPLGDGLVAAGTTATESTESLVVAGFGPDGSRTGSRTYGERRSFGRGAARLGEGAVVVGGAAGDGNPVRGFGVALADDGSTRWSQTYDRPNADATVFNDAVAGPSGAALAGAVIADGTAQPWVVTVDANGQQTFSRVYEADDGPSVKALGLTPDGGLVLAGETRGAADRQGEMYVTKLDAEGRRAWTDRPNPLGAGGTLFDVTVLDDGRSVVAGGVATRDGSDGYLAGYGPDGDRRWQHRYGGAGADLFGGVVPIADGLLCAGAAGWTSDDGDAWVALVDPS